MIEDPQKRRQASMQRSLAILIVLVTALSTVCAYLSIRYPGWCVAFSQAKGYEVRVNAEDCVPLSNRPSSMTRI